MNNKHLSYWEKEKLAKIKEAEKMEISTQDKELLNEFPPEIMLKKIEQKYNDYQNNRLIKKISRPIYLKYYFTAGVMALLVLITVNFNFNEQTDDILLKGKPSLVIYKKASNTDAIKLDNNSKVQAGETVQIEYMASGYKYGIIFSIDGNGNVTLHSPTHNTDSAFKVSTESFLPTSFELDNAPFYEKFYLVLSNKEFVAQNILSKIDKNGNLKDLGETFYTTTFILKK